LSRIRSLFSGDARLIAHEDTVRLDASACHVDATAVDDAIGGARAGEVDLELCRALLALFRGDLLQGLEVDGSPHFSAWLTAQRHRFRSFHAWLLERVAIAAPGDEALALLERWRQLAPYDPKVHRLLLGALVQRGGVREAEEHLQAAVKLFEDEGLDCAPLHSAWLAARTTSPAPAGTADTALRVEADALRVPLDASRPRRASIAVMPFEEHAALASVPGNMADALAHDIITRLAKLRSLFVIAPGTVFELKTRGLAPAEAARVLNVDYVVSGAVRRDSDRLTVGVELVDARAGRVVWTDQMKRRQADALQVLDEIGNHIVASIESEVEALERNRAVLKPPNSLDAWESHHRGLWHMYRFSRTDNDLARQFFQGAVKLDPTFSRAYAGLSFTHFQSAFQGWSERVPAIDLAFDTAGQALMADERDPAAHWAMGRALWLRSRQEQCVAELEQAVDLSPNFALGHYTLAFVHSQAGDPRAAIRASDYSRSLSPFDPLLFGMMGARALALVRLGNLEEAAIWAVQAAGRPNAHVHIQAIAAFSLALAGRMEEAHTYAATIRVAKASYGVAHSASMRRA
jgi:TolB-like protein/Flp pilus assembly protein TadD